LEFLELGIDFGLDEVESLGGAGVLSDEGLVFFEGIDCEEADKEASDEDGLHGLDCLKITIKLVEFEYFNSIFATILFEFYSLILCNTTKSMI